MLPVAGSIRVVWMVAISCWLRVLRTISSPLASDAYRKVRSSSRGNGERITAVNVFSGLVSSAWARARAEAIAPMVSLDWCIGALQLHRLEADRAGLGPFGLDPVADRLLGVLRHKLLKLGFCGFVILMRRAGP